MPNEIEGAQNAPNSNETTSDNTKRWLGSAGILAIGLMAGGFVLGDGLVRMKGAERSVTVRGLAEREVTADLATWTISYSNVAQTLPDAQAGADRDDAAI